MPLPAADKAESQNVHENESPSLSFAIVEGSMKAGEKCFSILNFGDDGLCVCSNEMRGANSNSAYMETVAREGVGQTSGIKGKVAIGAVNDGFGCIDVKVVAEEGAGEIS